MVIVIIGCCVLWLAFIAGLAIYAFRQSQKQDAIFMMRLAREHITIVGTAYKRAVANGDIQLIELCHNELHTLVNQYNKTFEKYGGHYDIRQWIEEE